mmetsp:Transcript_12608/g.39218  ORF Transcript_12608/g.39218 Transcript_12608/m.39218 type:complete len:297 (-) Transcript_12608:425-1315(-)
MSPLLNMTPRASGCNSSPRLNSPRYVGWLSNRASASYDASLRIRPSGVAHATRLPSAVRSLALTLLLRASMIFSVFASSVSCRDTRPGMDAQFFIVRREMSTGSHGSPAFSGAVLLSGLGDPTMGNGPNAASRCIASCSQRTRRGSRLSAAEALAASSLMRWSFGPGGAPNMVSRPQHASSLSHDVTRWMRHLIAICALLSSATRTPASWEACDRSILFFLDLMRNSRPPSAGASPSAKSLFFASTNANCSWDRAHGRSTVSLFVLSTARCSRVWPFTAHPLYSAALCRRNTFSRG